MEQSIPNTGFGRILLVSDIVLYRNKDCKHCWGDGYVKVNGVPRACGARRCATENFRAVNDHKIEMNLALNETRWKPGCAPPQG